MHLDKIAGTGAGRKWGMVSDCPAPWTSSRLKNSKVASGTGIR